MQYKDFFSDLYEAYPWGGFNATKSDVAPKKNPDGAFDKKDIAITTPRVSDALNEKDGPCWDGYQQIGMKEKDGKQVPNCVPIEEFNAKDIPSGTSWKTAGSGWAAKNRAGKTNYWYGKDANKNKEAADRWRMSEHVNEDVDEFCSACLADYMKQHAGMLEEAEYQGRKVPIGKPMRGDVKKFKVFVKDPSTGNVKKVNFGDKTMRIKKSNPARRKSFRARHNCDNPGPRTKARYWSCRKW